MYNMIAAMYMYNAFDVLGICHILAAGYIYKIIDAGHIYKMLAADCI